MVEAEREIERRVAVPGAFGIEEDRPARPDQDVLRADVAVHQGAPGARGGLDQGVQRLGAVRMRARARDQIRLEPDVVEDPVGRELRGDLRIVGGGGMDAHQAIADGAGDVRVGVAGAQVGLPQPVVGRVEIGHDQHARRRVLPEQLRHRLGHDRRRAAHPGRLVSVALDRREPVLLDPELGQRPLDAHRPARQLDPPDVRGHAAGQAGEARRVSVVQQPRRARASMTCASAVSSPVAVRLEHG